MEPVLFDMDGVILEGPRTDPQVYDEAADAALADLGADPTPAQRRTLRRHDLEGVEAACTDLGIDSDRFWRLKEHYASVGTHERIRSGDRRLYDDVDAIADLAARTPIGLVTNNRHETAAFVADHLETEFGASFDVVHGRDPTFEGYRRRKPDPYYVERALTDLDSDRGVYVGDFPKDVSAGTAAGLETAFLRRPHNRDLACPADATVELESLSEVGDVASID
ncbi:HAD family hydrolase [Halosolutus halophilus]|uniref:HAD family hydrolase n=1 Tax=Halosolutus halophilus TaxID=1552990 RepID=UPI0022350A75|nr:HAD-IA family hydrolase [Halosolutus halophilus]